MAGQLDELGNGVGRRRFLKASVGAALGASIMGGGSQAAPVFRRDNLRVWSCGGLAEAFVPANRRFLELSGVDVSYTGAFAAALGKSLLGSGTTEVFGGRVLELAKKLRGAGRMLYFKPLCFTSYVLVMPKGNPAGISGLGDLARKGVRLILAPQASPPGGKAVAGLLKKAGVPDAAVAAAAIQGSCVQRTMQQLVSGEGDVSVVERRLTRLPVFRDRIDIIDISEEYFPPAPLTFTIGVMAEAEDRELADYYVRYILSAEGQGFFEDAGFIPAQSEKGRELTEKLGVHDDAGN